MALASRDFRSLRLDGISREFGTMRALSDVSLTVERQRGIMSSAWVGILTAQSLALVLPARSMPEAPDPTQVPAPQGALATTI